MLLFQIKVNAASLSVTGSLSTTNTVVGNTITVTFKYSSSNPLGAIVYAMSYDNDKLTLISGTQSNALSYTGNDKSDTVKFTFKAKASGTANVSFKINEALDFDGNTLQASTISKSITIKTQKEIEDSYSKINNLTNLTINNGTLTPQFNKSTTKYDVEVENDVTSIIVDGKREDSKSSVNGFKEYTLDEGLNVIEVKVTAQNGSSKTYTINVTRKELSPIVVKVNNQDYIVIRKKELIQAPNDNFEETTIKIEDNEIPSLYNKATNTYLVGLKDGDGIIKLYKYENNDYLEYKEVSFNSIIITPTDIENIPEGFTKEKIKINDEEISAYKNQEDEIIVSGINIQSGKENLYKYDKNENTLQIYNNNLLTKISDLSNDKTNYLYIILILGAILIITYIVILINTIKKEKGKKEKHNKINKNHYLNKDIINNQEDLNNNDNSYLEEIIELDGTLHKDDKKSTEDLEEVEINSKKSGKIKEDISKIEKNKVEKKK